MAYTECFLDVASLDFCPRVTTSGKLSLTSQTSLNSSLETLRDPCNSTHRSDHNGNLAFLCVISNSTITTSSLLPTEADTVSVFVSIIFLESWHQVSPQYIFEEVGTKCLS